MSLGAVKIGHGENVVEKITENSKRTVITSDFPAIVKRVRVYLRMTQAEYSKRLDVSISTVRAWEQGRQYPSFENFECMVSLVKGSPISFELERAYQEQKGQ